MVAGVWLALWAGSLRPIAAQGARATVTGTVRNAQGAPQPSATVTVVNLDTQNERQAITEMDGTFVVGGLAPGRYQVKVDEAGSTPFQSDAFSLGAGQRRAVDVRLRPIPAPRSTRRPAPTPPRSPRSSASCEAVPPAPGAAAVPGTVPDYIPCPDRWQLEFPVWQRYPPALAGEYPYVSGRKLDPYNRNVLKGDSPVAGDDVFVVLSVVSETPFEFRRLPTPGGASTARPFTESFFGKPEQTAVGSQGIVSVELFKGDTAFKPRTWAFRVTPVFSLNYVTAGEFNVVNATPEEGKSRRRTDIALQEAFGEVKIADIGPSYDFISVRGGIQPFTSDFRGFLYRDTNLGVRAFGTWGHNRNQWNVAYFDQLEKQTNSELNLTARRNQKVFIANYFRQDFGTPGYTISPSFHANVDRGEDFFFDANGFLVRPAPIGLIAPHQVKAYYAGFGGDGHWGGLNISHQFYQAFGKDEFNGIAGRETRINAQFAAAEASVDHNWWRIKGTVVWASGDKDPDDDKAEGFDAIFDNPNIAGGPFSFWNREGIRLTQTFVGLKGRNSILPSLRSSKAEGQASFVNPGLLDFNVGWSATLTPKLNLSIDANALRFVDTSVLSRVLFQAGIDKNIGTDLGVGFQYRPALNDNVVITGGASIFQPSEGFKNVLTSGPLFAPFVVLTLRY
jgi:Carboxypeptidase regulatory-like domain